LAQEFPKDGLRAATTSTELPQAFTGTSTGTWTLLPDPMPGESVATPLTCESANAGEPYRDMKPVAAAATTIPLLRFCRNLVDFLLDEVRKAGLGAESGGPRPAVTQPGRLVCRYVSR
jgi:hypothetical protein